MTFVIIGACMGALGLMILTVGCLATGATRHKVYRAWKSRVGGRISCAVFMAVTYILEMAWILMFCFLVIVTFVFTIFWKMCENPRVGNLQDSIDFTQFCKSQNQRERKQLIKHIFTDFLFPDGTPQERMLVRGDHDVKLFCKDYVEKAEIMFIIAAAACVLVILSLVIKKNFLSYIKSLIILHFCFFSSQVHYLMCLAANYAHIRDHEKFQELQDLQFLNDPDMLNGKDRFQDMSQEIHMPVLRFDSLSQ